MINRKSWVVVVVLAWGFVLSSRVMASQTDFAITCTEKNECEQDNPDQPLFSEKNLQPGQQIIKTISITNKRKNDGCRLGLRARNNLESISYDLADQIKFDIFLQKTKKLSTPLTTLFADAPPLFLDILNPNTSKEYTWIASITESTDNNYQGTAADFDFDLVFTCDTTTRQPTPAPTTEITSALGTTATTATLLLSSCSELTPVTVPIVTIIFETDTTITLQWQKIGEATSYSLTFGTTDGKRRYADTNLGLTQQYTVGHLDPTQNYYFIIQALNNCAVGAASEPVFTTTKKNNAIDTAVTTANIFITPSPSPTGSVLGATTNQTSTANFSTPTTHALRQKLIILASFIGISLLILIILFLILFRRKKQKKR